ncbi:MAG TPA: zf-HC2 domain-containing protein [Planctomycetota bacterium]|jgi:hypothetical protein|nr:zf-HC2 domain-containing protein [Planctomycetota bacterium]
MLCRDAKFRIPDLRLGDLPPAERASLEQHLAECPACRQAAEEIGLVVDALRRDAESAARGPAPLVDLDEVLPRPPLPASLPRLVRLAARVAAVFLVGVGTASIFGMDVRAAAGSLTVSFALPGAKRAEGTPAPLIEFAEPIGLAVRREVEATLSPAFHDLLLWMTGAEVQRSRDLSTIAQWVEDRRRRDAAAIADVLSSTREDLDLTRTAVFEVAGQALRRQGW